MQVAKAEREVPKVCGIDGTESAADSPHSMHRFCRSQYPDDSLQAVWDPPRFK
jgi:hypothetical protein